MRAADIMTRSFLTIRRDTSWREALQLLLGDARNAAPVVDGGGHLVGIVTQTDLATRIGEEERADLRIVLDGIRPVRPPHPIVRWHAAPHWEHASKVATIMTTSVVTASAETPIAEVARRLRDHGIAQVPVVDREGGLLGMIARQEIVAAVAAGRVAPPPPLEEAFAAWANA